MVKFIKTGIAESWSALCSFFEHRQDRKLVLKIFRLTLVVSLVAVFAAVWIFYGKLYFIIAGYTTKDKRWE
jgi:hypothetical protein